MSDKPVRIGEDERAAALGTLVSAFEADPVIRWLWPDPEQYAEVFPGFASAFGGRAFDEGTAWRLDDLSAVALWMAPGIVSDGDAVVSLMSATVIEDKHADVFAVLEQLDASHPQFTHWYLPWLGVRSDRQGKGLGGRLLAPCLDMVDAAHLPAYLETPNPRTLPFYARHGFELVGEAQAGECPPLMLMLRQARP
jgi:GNAT superfamily N-acetyltransferase